MSDILNPILAVPDQFRLAMSDKGITPPDIIIPDGKLHRFSSSGKPDDDAGWYVFREGDVATGLFGDFRTGVSVRSWTAPQGDDASPCQKQSHAQKQTELRIQQTADKLRRRPEAVAKASTIIRISSPASDIHPYLVRKQVQSYGLRQWNSLIVIPMIDETGNLQSLQLIDQDGGKKFLSGGKVQGCFFTIGELDKASPILIAEGYATGATLHEALGLPVVVAFNAGNLLSVTKSVRVKYPDAHIIVCADDDDKTAGNPGLTKANEAAQAIGGKVIAPFFGPDRPSGATDFNDMAAHLGLYSINARFIGKSLELGYRAPVTALRGQVSVRTPYPAP